MPFLSVLIPVYNGEHYLADAIESVLDQPCQDLELIVANDGSTDRSLEIARKYESQDSRVRVITHENIGAGRTRNEGMALMDGTWSLFLDTDDAVLPDFYTEQLKDFLSWCLERDIEFIVPGRLFADETLSKAVLDRVPFDDVFPQGSDIAWNIDHEFANQLYATQLLRREHIQFSETRPEMESIFRHKAAFLARETLFTNELWFTVRRDNPYQTTKIWDLKKVHPVREQELAKLVKWHEDRGTTGFVLEEARRQHDSAVAQVEEDRRHKGLRERIKTALQERRGRKDWEAWHAENSRPVSDFVLDENQQREAIERIEGLVKQKLGD